MLLEVGRVVKPHGLRGETVVELVSNRPERSTPGASFSTASGTLRIRSARPFQGSWLVFFDGVETVGAAEALRGVVLRAAALDDPGVLWVHELVGAQAVRASDGRPVGRVVAVMSNPASDLLELEDGTLVPLRFVVEHQPGRVVLDAPEGLLQEPRP